MCAPHVLGPYLAGRPTGSRIFLFSAHEFLRTLRRLLALLGTPQANVCGLKAFRAGHAQELAVGGTPWAQILLAGEWKGLSALAYMNPDEVDAAAATREAIDASSSDDSQ